MSYLGRQIGLGALTLPPIHQGASFSLGVEIDVDCNSASGCVWMDSDEESIREALNRSGYVIPGVLVYQLSGALNPFIVIEGASGREYGSANHLRDAIISVMRGLGYFLNTSALRFQADTYDPQTGAPSTGRYDAPIGGGTSPPPDVVSDIGAGIVDTISDAFSIDRSTATLIGVGAGVLVLILTIGIVRR